MLSRKGSCLLNLSNYVSIISIVYSTPTLHNDRKKKGKETKNLRNRKDSDKSSTFLVCLNGSFTYLAGKIY